MSHAMAKPQEPTRRVDRPVLLKHKKICAWCQRQLQDGIEPASHGICAECKAIHFPHAP